jgi:hypothetical protein
VRHRNGADTHEYIVNLTGVPNASHLNATLNGVTDSALNSGDVSDTTDPASFRYDVNVGGRIDAGDVTTTRNATVTVLP